MLEALAGFAVSFLAKFLLGLIGEMKQTSAERETGRLGAELDHALDALRRQQAMTEIAARLTTRAEVLARLEKGSA